MRNYSRLAISAALASLALAAHAEQIWQVRGGTTSISFNTQVMKDLGFSVRGISETANPHPKMRDAIGFNLSTKSDLTLVTTGGGFREFSGGTFSQSGGFTVNLKKSNQNLTNFSIAPKGRFGWEDLSVRSTNGTPLIDLGAARILFDRHTKKLLIYGMDMTLSVEGAKSLGRPDMAGQYLGGLTIEANMERIGGDELDEPKPVEPPVGEDSTNDVQLFALSSLTQSGTGTGSFPNRTLGFGVSTTSCNTGTNNIQWYAAMDRRHPVIAFNVYRVASDRYEQISNSWLKHGWLATNSTSTGCAPCNSPGTGQLLGPGCSDTYGVFNNTDQDDLGPRNEINPFAGTWECTNSYFSGYINDCVKRNNNNGLSAIDHKLQVVESDLQGGTAYYYEAYYVTAGDTDKYNNLGSRIFNPSVSGGNWSFGSQTDFQRGPALQRWGNVRNIALPRDEGDVQVAVKVTPLTGNNYRYAYAVYVHDMDRQIREFAVPVPDSANVSNIYFHDPDKNTGNDWANVRGGGRIKWSTGPVGDNTANPITWSNTFSFSFDCDVEPRDAMNSLGMSKPGTSPVLTVVGRAPVAATFPTSMTILSGEQLNGGFKELFYAEGEALEILSDATTLAGAVELKSTAPAATPVMKFNLRSSAARAGLSLTVRMFNYTTNAWQTVGGTTATSSPSDFQVSVGSIADFIRASDREIKAQVSFVPINDEDPAQDGWLISMDMARWQFSD